MKLGINEATCKENSSLELDLQLCEKYHYDRLKTYRISLKRAM